MIPHNIIIHQVLVLNGHKATNEFWINSITGNQWSSISLTDCSKQTVDKNRNGFTLMLIKD